MPARAAVWFALRLLAAAAGVFACAQLTIQLPTFGDRVFPVWFPAGVMLFTLRRWAWAYAVGCATGMFLFGCQVGPWWVGAGVGLGAAASYALGAAALRRVGFEGAVDDLGQARRFVLLGVLLAPLPSALNGPLWLMAAGSLTPGDYPRAVAIWWSGDAVGVIALAPLLFTLPLGLSAAVRSPAELAHGLIGSAVALVVSAVVFLPGSPVAEGHLPLAFLPVLALSCISYLVPPRASAVALFATAAVAVVGTGGGGGPFTKFVFDPRDAASLLTLFTGAIGVATLLVVGARGTQQRLAAELRAAALDYRRLVDGSPTLICRYRADGRVTFANDTLCRFLSADREAVVGRDGAALGLPTVHPADDAEAECRDAAGGVRWVRWTSRQVGPDADGVPQFQAVGIDATARRTAEDERRAMEAQMFQAQKLESLGVIAGGVAHDFNNILTGILGNVEMAARSLSSDSAAAESLARAADAARRAADLNRQLLAYAGKGKFVVRPLDVNALLGETVELVRLSVSRKCAIRLQRWPRLPQVNADESQLQQVLMNLIINAGDAIGDAAGTITVRTEVVIVGGSVLTDTGTGRPAAQGKYVTVSVSDTGCGMDEATKAKIFDPFFTTKFTGRGLGLAAVQGIIRAHRGALQVDTAVGKGTTFTVYLPEFVPPAADDPPAAGFAVDRLTPRPTSKRNTVLVVDDEPAIRDLSAAILRHLGWEVLTAENGRAAVTVYRANRDRIACAILDLTMPELDGLETMAVLRADRPRLPVLLCTGYSAESLPPSPPGVPTGVLLKPFRPTDLEQALTDLLAAVGGVNTPIP